MAEHCERGVGVALMDAVWDAARAVAACAGIHHLGAIQDEVADLVDALDAYDRRIEAVSVARRACDAEHEEGDDREPQPSDGPDYHADHAAWRAMHGDTTR